MQAARGRRTRDPRRSPTARTASDRSTQRCPMASGGFTITVADSATVHSNYVLALINSKLLFWKLAQMSNLFRGGWITCTKQYLGELPIRRIVFKTPDKKRAALVEKSK